MDRPFRTAAAHYHARPPYSAELRPALAVKLGWDGGGRYLDVGCGPGTVTLELAPCFVEAIGLDPEPEMLAKARRRPGGDRVRWVLGCAEDLAVLDFGALRAVSFAQSLHRTDRDRVLALSYDALEPGGCLLLIHHSGEGFGLSWEPAESTHRPTGLPPLPHPFIGQLLGRYLGYQPGPATPAEEGHEHAIRRSAFGECERLLLPGRPDLVRTPEDIFEMILSMSFASPERFGDRLQAFREDLLAGLFRLNPAGQFWEWPGDTEVLIARKPVPGA
jgi:SAM-dependent methyltransferase